MEKVVCKGGKRAENESRASIDQRYETEGRKGNKWNAAKLVTNFMQFDSMASLTRKHFQGGGEFFDVLSNFSRKLTKFLLLVKKIKKFF